MGRLLPFECEHGVTMGGDESFGYEDVRCEKCDAKFADGRMVFIPDELVERVRDALDDPYGPETAAMFKTEYLILRDLLASIDGEEG